ncbi:MAG: hypothetical protein HYZ16_10355 [Bacteroidetes bacterium]|nr:hypothetical protein [Bacteroidota bacterium]
MNRMVFLLVAMPMLGGWAHAQVPPWSLDLGMYGYYYRAPLTISLGGASVQGQSRRADLDAQLGVFVFTNLAAGIRYSQSYDFLQVEQQFFNSATSSYEDYFQLANRWIAGVYARYYFDLWPILSVLAHAEFGKGQGALKYNQEDGNGGIEVVQLPRNLDDVAFGLGVSLRPHPDVGLEFMVLRRFRNEYYQPTGAGLTGLLQVEQYQGTELRVGLRIHLDVVHMLGSKEKPSSRPVIR